MRKAVLVLFLLILSLSACDRIVRGPGKLVNYEVVELNTSDGVRIVGSYYPSSSSKGLVMAPMMGKTRLSYKDIPDQLMGQYKVLVLDLRGHGASDGDFTQMTDAEFRGMQYDIAAAVDFLEGEGVAEGDVSFVGASIGANVVLTYVAEHPADKVVLLAPGVSYRNVDISRLTYDEPLFVQVGHYDAYASISVDELQANWDYGHVMVYDSSAHGSDLLFYDLSAKEDFLFYLT